MHWSNIFNIRLHGTGIEKQGLITLKIMKMPMLSRRKLMVHKSNN